MTKLVIIIMGAMALLAIGEEFENEVRSFIESAGDEGLFDSSNPDIADAQRKKIADDARDWESPLVAILESDPGKASTIIEIFRVRGSFDEPQVIRSLSEMLSLKISKARASRQGTPEHLSATKNLYGDLAGLIESRDSHVAELMVSGLADSSSYYGDYFSEYLYRDLFESIGSDDIELMGRLETIHKNLKSEGLTEIANLAERKIADLRRREIEMNRRARTKEIIAAKTNDEIDDPKATDDSQPPSLGRSLLWLSIAFGVVGLSWVLWRRFMK